MGQYALIGAIGLLISLQLAAAVKLESLDTKPADLSMAELWGAESNEDNFGKVSTQGAASCGKEFLIGKEVCKCEGREFGPGKVGDFVHDDRTDPAELDSKIKSFWDFNAFQHGNEITMKTFQSKLALVVNVASA